MMTRRDSRCVAVGGVKIGGGAPLSVQSMTNTNTADFDKTEAQIRSLAEATLIDWNGEKAGLIVCRAMDKQSE